MRNTLRKGIWALVLPLAIIGAAYSAGDCDHGKTAAAGTGSHCKLDKNVVSTAKMTDDGAVVTLKGKNDEAIAHIKSHLESHQKGEGCQGCPLSKEGVTADVQVNDDGGTITAHGNSPEAIKAIQEWAKQSHPCCMGHKNAEKA